jgi:RNA polymerase sigma-70 factor (ECF subfamily)
LQRERPRLVRLCAHLSCDPTAADDLAQETLVEAWRNAHKLTDPAGHTAWLSAIARNVCRRWARRQGRELARSAPPPAGRDAVDEPLALDDLPAAGPDVEVELERSELVTLLDRALAALPPETRLALIERFVAESPLSEIAARLGLSQGAAAVRLHRGKLALRRVLTTTLHAEAVAHGLVDPASEAAWTETRLWCPDCGRHRLIGRMNSTEGDLSLRCPGCLRQTGIEFQESQGLRREMGGAKGFKTAYNRLAVWADSFYRPGLARGTAACTRCGAAVQPRVLGPREREGGHYVDASCAICAGANTQSLRGTVLCLAAGRAFWRQHPRIFALPERALEAHGLPALATGFQSLTTAHRLDVVVARDTFRVLDVHLTGQA